MLIDNFKRMFRMSILSSIAFLALGLFLFLKPETAISTISYILGIVILILGGGILFRYLDKRNEGNFFHFDLIYGVFSVLFGAIILIKPYALATIIPFVLGIWIVTNSIVKMQYALYLKKYHPENWHAPLVVALITFLWGIIFIFNPFKEALVITKIIGLFIIVYAILDITNYMMIRKNIDILKKMIQK